LYFTKPLILLLRRGAGNACTYLKSKCSHV